MELLLIYIDHSLEKKVKSIYTTKFIIAPLNPQSIHTISLLYPYYGNIQLLWIIKIHSISSKHPFNFHTMTLKMFSSDFGEFLVNQGLNLFFPPVYSIYIIIKNSTCQFYQNICISNGVPLTCK